MENTKILAPFQTVWTFALGLDTVIRED